MDLAAYLHGSGSMPAWIWQHACMAQSWHANRRQVHMQAHVWHQEACRCELACSHCRPLTATSGPPRRTRQATVSFGAVPVLMEHFSQLHIHNPCPIAAEIQLFVEGEESAFAVGQRSAVLDPGASLVVALSCLLDEVQPFRDVLHMLVSDGHDVAVVLEASGGWRTAVMATVIPYTHTVYSYCASTDLYALTRPLLVTAEAAGCLPSAASSADGRGSDG
jgi:hypothetical protein